MSGCKQMARRLASQYWLGAMALLAGAGPVVAQDDDDAALGEMIVTAQKRAENIRDVPAAITSFGEQQLEDLHATQLSDFAAYVPGLQVVSGGTPGQTTVAMRGIAPVSPGATIGSYIDETPIGSSGFYQRQTIFALDLLPYDVQRVEVLRGPQGTLYGAGSMGGLLKYVTRDPDLTDYEFRVGGGVSEAEGAGDINADVRASANLPLVEDRFAVRASYSLNEVPAFIDNAADGREDVNEGEQESARISALWQMGESASLKLTGMKQTIDTDNNGSTSLDPTTLEPTSQDLENVLFVDEPFEKDVGYYAATLNWNLGAVEFTSATGYSDVSTDQRVDATLIVGEFPLLLGLPPGISFFDLGLDLQQLTQEFRLTSTGEGAFAWQLGAFYTDEDAENTQVIRLQDTAGVPIAGLDPLAVLGLPSTYEELALFVNGSYEFSERFELGVGVRYAQNEQEFAQVVTDGILVPIGTTPGSSDEDVVTWSFSPKFQLNDDAMLYLRVATGYQPGGPNVALPNVPPTVDSSQLISYEAGLKSEFSDRRVLFDLTAFYIDWDDIQVTDSGGGVSWLVNGGKATSQGVELATAFKAGERWRFDVNAAYTDATLSEDVPAIGGFEGDQLPFIPELSASAVVNYDFPIGDTWDGHVGVGYRWVDDRQTSVGPATPVNQLDSYGAVDLNADLSSDRWTLRAYAKNLSDERAYTQLAERTSLVTGVPADVVGTPILPRTYGVQLDFRF